MPTALRAVVLMVAFGILLPVAARGQANPDWHRAIPGFKIAGNLYYVGTADLAAYLVATPQGNILINGNFKQDVPAIRRSIEGLGFNYADTKIILISHAHGDHDEGVGLVKSDTGARLMVMDADVAQVESTLPYLSTGPSSYVSVFAGRVADAGCDPVPVMRAVLDHIRPHPQIELIWASPREVFNIVQANDIDCHIITVTNDLLAKLPLLGRNLEEFSLDTVKMFRNDAVAAGYSLSGVLP